MLHPFVAIKETVEFTLYIAYSFGMLDITCNICISYNLAKTYALS